ncbi:serine/threonine protein kinase [bacterium]|nr:serine/threonine protein kinase [bacterium]
MIPQQIGHCEILELVGSGGLGEVYRAKDKKTGHIVALKRLHDKYQNSLKLLGLFHKEILMHAQVSHKHCVKFIEANLTPPNAHIITEFIEGINCHYLLKKVGPIPPLIACCITLDLLQGLDHIHCLDMVHSDLTPANVLLEVTGRTVLADFGLSCNQEVEDYEGMTVGTPGYQAPERLSHGAMTPLSDIYNVGLIFHELLLGERIFPNPDPKEVMSKMKVLPGKFPSTGDATADEFIFKILKTSLHLNPQKRFPSARDFMFAIYQVLKVYDIRFTRRAILQWMIDAQLTTLPPAEPKQIIYIK